MKTKVKVRFSKKLFIGIGKSYQIIAAPLGMRSLFPKRTASISKFHGVKTWTVTLHYPETVVPKIIHNYTTLGAAKSCAKIHIEKDETPWS